MIFLIIIFKETFNNQKWSWYVNQENLRKLAATDRAVSLISFDTDSILLAALNQWIDLQSGEAFDPDSSLLVSKTTAKNYCAETLYPNI